MNWCIHRKVIICYENGWSWVGPSKNATKGSWISGLRQPSQVTQFTYSILEPMAQRIDVPNRQPIKQNVFNTICSMPIFVDPCKSQLVTNTPCWFVIQPHTRWRPRGLNSLMNEFDTSAMNSSWPRQISQLSYRLCGPQRWSSHIILYVPCVDYCSDISHTLSPLILYSMNFHIFMVIPDTTTLIHLFSPLAPYSRTTNAGPPSLSWASSAVLRRANSGAWRAGSCWCFTSLPDQLGWDDCGDRLKHIVSY